MKCDKCQETVEPSNNAVLYMAALSALLEDKPVVQWPDGKLRKYVPAAGYLYGDPDAPIPIFLDGQIISGNPEQSVRNIVKMHDNGMGGRHLYPTTKCVGSPTSRNQIEKGVWGTGIPMAENAQKSKEAYETLTRLKF